MQIKLWINPLFVGLLILFSLPLKLPALQHWLENLFSISFPIRLSLYTFFLPPTVLLCLFWNRGRITEIWDKLRLPLIILVFLFWWMWLGAIMSDYQVIALKHSGRYSIILLTFLALLFALDRNSIKKKRTNFHCNICFSNGSNIFRLAWENQHSRFHFRLWPAHRFVSQRSLTFIIF